MTTAIEKIQNQLNQNKQVIEIVTRVAALCGLMDLDNPESEKIKEALANLYDSYHELINKYIVE